MADEKLPEEWAAEYRRRHPVYVDYARRIEALIRDLLSQESIDYIHVESRAKTVASFADKIQRKRRQDTDPFASVTDLVGVRVITYYLDDVVRVGDILRCEFTVDDANSMDKADALASDQFGYRSAHYVARLTDKRSALGEWLPFANIPVEFQVRTSLQHAWAAVSHKLDYKAAQEAPEALRRRLFRLSALFELADEQFAVIRDEREATVNAYDEEVSEGRLQDVPIDTSALAVFWSSSDSAHRFRDLLVANELFVDIDDAERILTDRQDLVQTSRECGISTLEQLDQYISSERVQEIIEVLAAYRTDKSPEIRRGQIDGSIDDVLNMIMLVDFNRLDDLAEEKYISRFVEHLRNASAPLPPR
jgi:putative GTP pyrophosphokinase